MNIIFELLGLQKIINKFDNNISMLGWHKANKCYLEDLGIKVNTEINDFPKKGAVLVYSNHPTGLDPYFLSGVFPRDDVYFISDIYQTKKGENITQHIIPVYNNWKEFWKKSIIQWAGFLWMRFIAGSDDKKIASRKNSQAILDAINHLRKGHVVIIFPSGGDNIKRPWKQGIGRIVVTAQKQKISFTLYQCYIKGIKEQSLFRHFFTGRKYFLTHLVEICGIILKKNFSQTDQFAIAQELKNHLSATLVDNRLCKQKIWGGSIVRLSPTYLGYVRLLYCLQDIESIKGKILDVGCGGGGFTKAIKKYRPDLQVYGCDINNKAIKAAKEHMEGVIFSEGSIYKLPFASDEFDCIIFADVLEHIKNPQKALNEVSRVLKKRGVGHFYIPLEGEKHNLHFYAYKLGWRSKEKLAGHIQQFTFSSVEKMLQHAGLTILTKRYSGYFLTQFIDILFYSLLSLKGKALNEGFEKSIVGNGILTLLKNFVAVNMNQESLLFRRFSGAGIHVLLVKQ